MMGSVAVTSSRSLLAGSLCRRTTALVHINSGKAALSKFSVMLGTTEQFFAA